MPHVAVAPVGRCAADGNEEGDVRHVAADAGPAQPAQRKKIIAREWAYYYMHDRNVKHERVWGSKLCIFIT
jgi:hypothetical protein